MITIFKEFINESHTDDVAKQIKDQVGHKTLYMLGAKHLVAGDSKNGNPYLSFKISGSKKVNHIKIELNSKDTYNLVFYKVGKDFKIVNIVDDISIENLHKTIEDNTGLHTSL